MKSSVVKQLFIACINFKTDACQPGTKDCLSNITGAILKLQKSTGEHQQLTISLGKTQITSTHRGGRKPQLFLVADLIHFQQAHVLFYLKSKFNLIFLVYHQNLSFFTKLLISRFLANFACSNLSENISDVNLINS